MGPALTHSCVAGKLVEVFVPVLGERGDLDAGSSFSCTWQPLISRGSTPPQAITPPFRTNPLPLKSKPEKGGDNVQDVGDEAFFLSVFLPSHLLPFPLPPRGVPSFF